MSAKGFLNLSQDASLSAYKSVLANSDKKWETARRIAGELDFGTATSVAVGSVEELIKALLIAMNGYGFQFRKAPTMERFFRNHQIRYVVAYAMFVINIFVEDLKKLVVWIRLNPEQGLALAQDLQEKRATREMEVYLEDRGKKIIEEFEWFEKVDTFRQEGMYTDFDGGLKSPLSITAEVYAQTIDRLEKVRHVGKAVIEYFESEGNDDIKFIENLKQQFIDGGYYGKIESALKGMKRPQVPFESLRAFFSR